ncbi:MAG: LLM class flavin-dependent oxidoreductase [Streptosporangiaceae bacterium]
MPRVGLYFDLRNPPAWEVPWAQHYARALETMEQAEALGASALWLTEHHFFADGYLPQPLTMAAAVAARTTRVRIGTAVYLPLLRNPVQVAEEAAIVDILSGGRLDLGIGVGYQPAEFAAFGARMNRRFADLESHVGALRSAWAGPVTPKPVQSPLPLWGGFFGPRGARLAGRLDLGLLAAKPDLLGPYRAGLTEAGHDPARARLRALSPVILADDPEAAWPLMRPHVDYQWNNYRPAGTGDQDVPVRRFDVDRWAPSRGGSPWFVLTDVQGAITHLTSMAQDIPLEEVYCWATLPGLSADLASRHVELLLTEVAPRLQAAARPDYYRTAG